MVTIDVVAAFEARVHADDGTKIDVSMSNDGKVELHNEDMRHIPFELWEGVVKAVARMHLIVQTAESLHEFDVWSGLDPQPPSGIPYPTQAGGVGGSRLRQMSDGSWGPV